MLESSKSAYQSTNKQKELLIAFKCMKTWCNQIILLWVNISLGRNKRTHRNFTKNKSPE